MKSFLRLIVRDLGGSCLTAHSSQLLFFIQQVHLTRTSVHKKLNNGPSLRLMMSPLRARVVSHTLRRRGRSIEVTEHRAESNSTEAAAHPRDDITAREVTVA